MPEQSQVANALRNWFLTCDVLKASKLVGIDYLASNLGDFSIFLQQSELQTSTDILGNMYINPIRSQSFSVGNTKPYGAAALQNLQNLGVLDKIADWMIEQNKNGNFPDLPGVISCLPISTPTLYMSDGDLGYYQINGILKYKKG